MKTDLETQ